MEVTEVKQFQGRRYFHGRQTVANHLVHTGTDLYHVMMSSIPSWLIFCGLYFHGSRSVHENHENLHQEKNSRYTVVSVAVVW